MKKLNDMNRKMEPELPKLSNTMNAALIDAFRTSLRGSHLEYNKYSTHNLPTLRAIETRAMVKAFISVSSGHSELGMKMSNAGIEAAIHAINFSEDTGYRRIRATTQPLHERITLSHETQKILLELRDIEIYDADSMPKRTEVSLYPILKGRGLVEVTNSNRIRTTVEGKIIANHLSDKKMPVVTESEIEKVTTVVNEVLNP